MGITTQMKQVMRNVTSRSGPRFLTVKKAWHLTPNMIRVTFAGPELTGFPEGREGGNCKLLLPDLDESKESFFKRLQDGPSPAKRTFTVRCYRADVEELDIDFVDHGDNGPASRWANHAKPGAFLGFQGPSPAKVTTFDADWYLVAADPSAIPVAAATLEAMPRDAKGVAFFEVATPEDVQAIDAPNGVEMHWLINPDPSVSSPQQENLIRGLDWSQGRVQTCIAGESGAIRSLRAFLAQEQAVPREDTYISGYWKIGLIEDEHQKAKRAEG